jgi:hypothetical protein
VLTAESQDQIDRIQRESLLRAATAWGSSVDHFISISCANINRSHGQLLQMLPSEAHDELRTEADWWAYRNKEAQDVQDLAATAIERAQSAGALDGLGIAPDLLRSDFLTAGIECSSDTLGSLVRAIPTIHMSDLSFNALATRGDFSLPFPHIRSYFGTERLIQLVGYWLADWCLSYDPIRQTLWARGPEGVVPPPRDSDIVKSVHAVIRMVAEGQLLWRNDEMPFHRETNDELAINAARAHLALGGKLMLLLHEVAHHLLGHLHVIRDPIQEERDADRFAAICLGHLTDTGTRAGLLLAGATIPFFLMAPHDRESATHPPSLHRAQMLIDYRHQLCGDGHAVLDYILMPLICAIFYLKGGMQFDAYRERFIDPIIAKMYECNQFSDQHHG